MSDVRARGGKNTPRAAFRAGDADVRGAAAKGSSDAPRKVFINCVMHELVKRPLNAAMEVRARHIHARTHTHAYARTRRFTRQWRVQEVGEEHLDHMGIANLRVPLDVGEARECSDNSGEKATAIGALHACAGRDAAIAFTRNASHCIHARL